MLAVHVGMCVNRVRSVLHHLVPPLRHRQPSLPLLPPADAAVITTVVAVVVVVTYAAAQRLPGWQGCFPQLLGQAADSRPAVGQHHAAGTQLVYLASDSLSADELQLHGCVCLVQECVVVVHSAATCLSLHQTFGLLSYRVCCVSMHLLSQPPYVVAHVIFVEPGQCSVSVYLVGRVVKRSKGQGNRHFFAAVEHVRTLR